VVNGDKTDDSRNTFCGNKCQEVWSIFFPSAQIWITVSNWLKLSYFIVVSWTELNFYLK
jgi:hypothetical protein